MQMTIAVGDTIPDVELRTMSEDGPQAVQSSEVLGKGKVLLFAVPGAFTPGCSKIHLPGYLEGLEELKGKGVDTIACLAVNDAWVMEAWAESQGVEGRILMLADGNGEFTKAMGLEVDLGRAGLGERSQRYAAIVEDGIVRSLEVEPAAGVDVSSCQSMLARL
jgi:peroxiredoxin